MKNNPKITAYNFKIKSDIIIFKIKNMPSMFAWVKKQFIIIIFIYYYFF